MIHIFTKTANILFPNPWTDRIGCAVLVEVQEFKRPQAHGYRSFSVQEEIGLVGASVAVYDFSPLLCVAVDVTDLADYPKGLKRHAMVLGKGLAIKIKDRASISFRKAAELLEQAAQKAGVSTKRKF